MSILIKGLKMPEKCLDCKLCAFIPIGDNGLMTKCLPLNRATDVEKLRPDCPLVAVPDHGDLIDMDSLIYELGEEDEDLNTYHTLLYAPVVIPAERREDGQDKG